VRAIQIKEFGGPEVLQLVELPRPEPGPDEVLIEVSRAGLNFADTHQRTNSYLAKAELPLIPGSEVAGRRADTGERVVALCGQGGYAEYALAPEELAFPIPEGVGDEIALALLLQGLTAWHLYRTCAHVGGGDVVVVHSAAGGVGSLAVQLGKPLGAGRVIATASSEEKRKLALDLGADARVQRGAEGGRRFRDGRGPGL
jgi:NADPH2:quinone reductase